MLIQSAHPMRRGHPSRPGCARTPRQDGRERQPKRPQNHAVDRFIGGRLSSSRAFSMATSPAVRHAGPGCRISADDSSQTASAAAQESPQPSRARTASRSKGFHTSCQHDLGCASDDLFWLNKPLLGQLACDRSQRCRRPAILIAHHPPIADHGVIPPRSTRGRRLPRCPVL